MVMDEVKTNLRLPEELYDEIKRIAEKEHRSINGQMVAMLQEAAETRQRKEQEKRG